MPNPNASSTLAPVFGNFVIQPDYTVTNGVWIIHLVNDNPGGGNPSDYYVSILQSEMPDNINQVQLEALIEKYLKYTYNAGFAPLNTAIANNMTIQLTPA